LENCYFTLLLCRQSPTFDLSSSLSINRSNSVNLARPRPRVLFLSAEWPENKISASARRAAALLETLQRVYEVEVVIIPLRIDTSRPAHSPYPEVPLPNSRSWRLQRALADRVPLLFQLYLRAPLDRHGNTRKRTKALRQVTAHKSFDLIFVMRLLNVPYAFELSRSRGGVPIWLDLDDLESSKNEQISRLPFVAHGKKSRLFHATLAAGYRRFEARWLKHCERLFVCSSLDQQRVVGSYPDLDVRVVPNPTPPVNQTTRERPTDDSWNYLFFGTLNYPPNFDAVVWLGQEIWPLIRAKSRDILHIAGQSASRELVQQLEPIEQLDYRGFIPLEENIYNETDVVLIPLRAGSGTRLKALEAFAARVPVISTSLGVEGLGAIPETHYLRAETTQEFADQAHRLKSDPALFAKLRASGSHLAHEAQNSTLRLAAVQP